MLKHNKQSKSTRYTEANTRYTETNTRYTETSTRYTETSTRYTETSTRYTETSTRYTETSTRYTETSTRYTETKSIFRIHDPIGRSHKWRHNLIDTLFEMCSCNQAIEDKSQFLFLCPFYAIQTAVANVINIIQKSTQYPFVNNIIYKEPFAFLNLSFASLTPPLPRPSSLSTI